MKQDYLYDLQILCTIERGKVDVPCQVYISCAAAFYMASKIEVAAKVQCTLI